ncbi:uncharacterized protein [Clytia hemisphaerica]|uniref:uncharacterized protein n=1 Tax=Clytia hemisphaerica TaxID=252671 RepID=UPI0034D7B409
MVKLVNSFDEEEKEVISKRARIAVPQISAEAMTAMKIDNNLSGETMRRISRDRSIRVFVFGDYEFLCPIYGLTGASGRHCCLYCNTTYANMQPQKKDQAANTPRSLKTLREKLNKFRTAGGNDIKNAKEYDNVIDDAMFNVELDQVAIPSLHISLGSYLKFFKIMEFKCHLLGVKMAGELGLQNKTINRADSSVSMR